jgi:hypothetical protein
MDPYLLESSMFSICKGSSVVGRPREFSGSIDTLKGLLSGALLDIANDDEESSISIIWERLKVVIGRPSV